MKTILLMSLFAVGVFGQGFQPTSNAGTDVVCAAGSDVITNLTCNNSADATTITPFASSVTVKANTLSSNTLGVHSKFSIFAGGTAPTLLLTLKLGTTTIWAAPTTAPGAAFANFSFELDCDITAVAVASSTTPLVTHCAAATLLTTTMRSNVLTNAAKTVAVDTTVDKTLQWSITYSANTTQNATILYGMSGGSSSYNGQALFSSAVPTVSGCGVSSTCTVTGNDNAFSVLVTPASGEFIQGFTVAFGSPAFRARPSCKVGVAQVSQAGASAVVTTTTMTIQFTSPIAGYVDIQCF